jgi:hypothetical protein
MLLPAGAWQPLPVGDVRQGIEETVSPSYVHLKLSSRRIYCSSSRTLGLGELAETQKHAAQCADNEQKKSFPCFFLTEKFSMFSADSHGSRPAVLCGLCTRKTRGLVFNMSWENVATDCLNCL